MSNITNLFSSLSARTFILLLSTTFSILAIMLILNIISAHDVASILNLDEKSAKAFELIVKRFQEVSHNIVEILSKLLNNMLGWTGIHIDLTKVNVDLNSVNHDSNSTAPVQNHDAKTN